MTNTTSPTSVTVKKRQPRRPVENLDSLLEALANKLSEEGEEVSFRVRDILEAVGRRAYGPLLLAVGLFSISPATIVPGLTWVAAIITALIAGQMALGMKLPWLPRQMLNASAPTKPLLRFLNAARPTARVIDRILRPRLSFLTVPPFVNLIALLCVAASIVTIPLGFFPFLPTVPGIAIVLFGLGMTARDGLLLLVAIAFVAAAGKLAYDVSDQAITFLSQLGDQIQGWIASAGF